MTKSGWIIRFRRLMVENEVVFPLLLLPKRGSTVRVKKSEKPSGPVEFKPADRWERGTIRYWTGRWWSMSEDKAWRYADRDRAETVAFNIVAQNGSLFSELVVEEWIPLAKPNTK